MQSASQQLIEFCRGDTPDMDGRYLRDMLEWRDNKLEVTHDYIQWMFPSTERSYANPTSPYVDEKDVAEISSDERIRENLKLSLHRILRFYGLEMNATDRVRISRTAFFAERRAKWFWKRNHNFFRITRILKSLRLCGLNDEARAFFDCLEELYREDRLTIGAETFSFWQAAAAEKTA